MIRSISLTGPAARLLFLVLVAVSALNASAAFAQPSLGAASGFAVLGGGAAAGAVTCTNSTVTGNVGVVVPGTFVKTLCTVTGTVDPFAATAYSNFLDAYNGLAALNIPSTCDLAHTLTGTLANAVLSPGTYCVDAAAKTGLLTLNGNASAVWIFLVNGALTGTTFNVVMMNGGKPCNVYWWVKAAVTMTTSLFTGTILAGEDITSTGSILKGAALAGGAGSTFLPTGAVTLTGSAVSACSAAAAFRPSRNATGTTTSTGTITTRMDTTTTKTRTRMAARTTKTTGKTRARARSNPRSDM